MTKLKHSTPEQTGVPSISILNFMKKLEAFEIPIHSLLISRHNKLITEAYYPPFNPDTLHRMFSISKSFTSIAIGQLQSLGMLSINDNIVDYFPDMLPDKIHPFIAKMTIKDMLTMQTCHTTTTFKINSDFHWVKSFFTTIPSHPSGTIFNYDTSASHTLCALVERLTHMPMLDFLRESFLNKIGFSQEAYMIQDPFGVSMGGSGLMATSMDMMLFATLLINQGNINGEQLVSKDYIREATAHHSNPQITMSTLEESQGYGYQIWRIQNNGFVCYGMGGQLTICLPDDDLVVVTTADTQGIQGGNQLIYNSLYEEILPYLSEDSLPVIEEDKHNLEEYIQKISLKPLKGNLTSEIVRTIHKQIYHLDSNPSGFTSLLLEFSPTTNEGQLIITKDDRTQTLAFGLGHLVTSKFPVYDQQCASSGIWLKPNTLYIKTHLIDECVGSVYFHLVFKDNSISIYMKKIEETYFKEFSGFFNGTSDFIHT